MGEKPTRRSHEQWKELIAEQQAGDQTVTTFCKDRDLTVHSYYYHKQKMNAEAGGFVQLPLSTGGLRLRPDGANWALELDRDFDPVCLKRVLQLLGAA